MTTVSWRNDTDDTAAGALGSRRVRRRVGVPSGRAVLGGLLMALAAIGTFVVATGRDAEATIDVVVAIRDLRPGDTITVDDVELVPLEVPDGVGGLFGSTEAAVGRQMTAAVDEGEFLLGSATVVPTEGEERLELALTLPGTRVVGDLRPGERVDVFSTWDSDTTELIAVDARVLDVDSGAGLLGEEGGRITVRLALGDFGQVEALVHAQAVGDLTMIRATIGSEVEDLGRRYRPGAATVEAGDTGDDDVVVGDGDDQEDDR